MVIIQLQMIKNWITNDNVLILFYFLNVLDIV